MVVTFMIPNNTTDYSPNIKPESRNRNKILIILFLAILLGGIVYFLNTPKEKELTEAERMKILEELSQSHTGPDLTAEEKQIILEDIDAESTGPSLTEEEKMEILNNLDTSK